MALQIAPSSDSECRHSTDVGAGDETIQATVRQLHPCPTTGPFPHSSNRACCRWGSWLELMRNPSYQSPPIGAKASGLDYLISTMKSSRKQLPEDHTLSEKSVFMTANNITQKVIIASEDFLKVLDSRSTL